MSIQDEKIERLAQDMRKHMESFVHGARIPGVHLFGIDRGPDMEGLTVADCNAVAEKAGLKPSLGTELHKGIRLSRYVTRK